MMLRKAKRKELKVKRGMKVPVKVKNHLLKKMLKLRKRIKIIKIKRKKVNQRQHKM